MARPVTRTKNTSQRPGQILLDMKQKRRTSEQKQTDDADAKREREEAAAAHERGIKHLANIISQMQNEEDGLLTNTHKPSAKVRKVTKPPLEPISTSEYSEQEGTMDTMEVDVEPEEEDGLGEAEGCEEGYEDGDADSNEDGDEKQDKEVHGNKDGVHDADSWNECVDGQPEKEHQVSASIQNAKKGVVGLGDEEEWAEKVASANFKTLLSHRSSTSSSHPAWSISSAATSSHFKGPWPTPASISSGTCPSSPLTDLSIFELVKDIQDDVQDDDPYIQGTDQVERVAIPSVSAKLFTHRSNIMDVTDVVATSEPDEATPPTTQSRIKNDAGTKDSRKWARQSEDSTSKWSGSSAKKKYNKDDLPCGSTDNNMWRRKFISVLAHFASSYDHPWTIPTDKLVSMLQEIWNVVYGKKIKYTVVPNSAVFQLAKQSLNVWRSGFTSAAMSVVTTFFTNNEGFNNQSQHIAFAKAMLKRNCFLCEVNKGVDSKAWTGLWRAPIVLQTFTHHFNYIHGKAVVPALEGNPDGPRMVLALVGAVLCRVLTLISEGHITFKISESKNGKVWTAVVRKGNQYEFNDTVWGMTTRRYLEPIQQIPSEKFALIVEEMQEYVKKNTLASAASNSADSGDNSELEELFAYHRRFL